MGKQVYRNPPFFTSALAGGTVSFQQLPFYSGGKSPRYPLKGKMGRP
jgi:hypothetical protein